MTTSDWNVSTSGDWSDASDWSGGVPNSSSDDAVIAKSGTYTVTIGSSESFTVGSVTLNDANATLEIDGTLNLANTLTLTEGTLNLTGTIDGGTINTGGGTLDADGGTLAATTVQGTINLFTSSSDPLVVLGGLDMAGINGSGAGTINFSQAYSDLQFSGTETISNTTFAMNTNVDTIFDYGAGTVTIAATTAFNQSAANTSVGIVGTGSDTGTVVNDGTINASAGGDSSFVIGVDIFSNAGTISVTNGDTLQIFASNFDNTGTISVDGASTLQFGAVTTGELGTIDTVSGSTLYFSGTLDNAGATYVPAAGVILAGTIEGGTIQGTISVGTVHSLTLSGDPTMEGAGGSGQATINLTQTYGYSSVLSLSGTIDDTVIDSNGGQIVSTNIGTLGPSTTVDVGSSGTMVGDNGDGYVGSLVNDGSVDVDSGGEPLMIESSAFTNAGSITISNNSWVEVGTFATQTVFTNTGTISIDGTSRLGFDVVLTTAQVGTIDAVSGAAISFTELMNVGATLVIPQGVTVSGEIDGGTIEGTLNGSIALVGNIQFEGAGGIGAGTINETGYQDSLDLYGPMTTDDVVINVGYAAGNGTAIDADGNATVTFGPSTTISQTGSDTYASLGPEPNLATAAGYGTFISNGIIDAAATNNSEFFINVDSFTNNGKIEVTNGETLIDSSPDFVNMGTITVGAGSTLVIQESISTGQLGTIAAAAGATLEFLDLNNVGETFIIPTGVALEAGTIDGGTIEGSFALTTQNASITLEGNVAMLGAGGSGPGAINDTGNNSALDISGFGTLSNATISLGNSSDYQPSLINLEGGALAYSVTVNQTGAGNYAEIAGPGTLAGVINAESDGGILSLIVPTSGTLTNFGSILVSGGDTLDVGLSTNGYQIETTFSNTGTISVDGTSTLNFDTALTTAELGTIIAAPGAVIDFMQSLDNVGATFVIPNGVVLEGTIDGGTIEGTLNLNGAVKVFTLEGGPTFAGAGGLGAGTINLNASTDCTLYLSGDQTVSNVTVNIGSTGANNYGSITLENAGTITLSSTVSIDQTAPNTLASLGSFGISGTIVTDGTITAASNGGTFVLDQGDLTNNGTISVSNGDTLLDQDTNFTNSGSITESSGSLIVIDPTNFTNYGTIAQTGSKAAGFLGEDANISVTEAGTLVNDGTIDAASNGGALALDPGTLTNEGVVEASNGSLLLVGGVNAFTNMSETGELTGGTYEASAGSTIEFGTFENLIIDDATLIVNGLGSVLEDVNLSTATSITPTPLTSILEGVDTRGVLEILGGQSWTTSITFENEGTIELGGGTFSAPDLDNSGMLTGYGTFDAPISNGGAYGFIASGGTLNFASSLTNVSGPTLGSDITLGAEANSTLQLPAGLIFTGTVGTIIFGGTGAAIQSLNGSAEVGIQSTLVNIGDGGTLEVLGGDNFTSSNAIVNDGTIQLGGGSFSSTALTNASGATLEGFGTVASVVNNSGTVTATGGVLEFTAKGNVFAGTIGGQEVDFAGGTDSFESGASVTTPILSIYGGAAVTLGTSLNAGILELGEGTVFLGDNTLTLNGYGSTISGTISGPGTLVSQGAQTISGTANLEMSQWNTNDTDEITIDGNVSYGGSFTLDYLSDLTVSAGNTFSGSGSLTIGGVVAGAGTFVITGGTTVLSGFGDVGTSVWTISGGAVSIDREFGYAGHFDQEAGTSISIEADSNLSLNGTADVAGSVSGAGSLIFAGSNETISSGAKFTVSEFQIGATGVIELAESLVYSGAFTLADGGTLAIASSDMLTLSGASSIAGTISGGGMLTVSGGAVTIGNATSLAVATLSQSGGVLTLGGNLIYTGNLTQSGGTIALGANTLTLSGAGSTLSGAISGTGTLALKGGSQTFGSGASLSVANLNLTSTDALTAAANTSYAGALSIGSGSSITLDSGDTLSLSGTTTLQGTIGGSGTLSLGGGTLFADSGAAINTNQLALGGTATLGLKESLVYAGVVSEASGGAIAVGPGSTLTLSGSGSTLDGTITGKGTLLLDGGTDTLKGTTMQVSDWTLSDGAVATFATDINYAGALTEEAGTTLSLGSKVLNLTGAASDFAGAITGTAAFNLKGGSQEFDAGATISTAHWNLAGKDSITIDGDLTYAGAFSSGNGTKIAISSGDTLDLTGDATISSKVSGAGTLELSGGTDVLGRGAGVTVGTLELTDNASVSIDAVVKDTGALSIDATSSLSVDSHKSFDLTGAATGAGTFVIDANATLEFGSTVASTLTANFDGTSAILKLADLSGFDATISGFAVGDTIDLMHHGANSATLGAGDELVIKHNSTVVATLQLSGDYTGYTFETSSDDHGGTDITLMAPPESGGLHIIASDFSPDWHLG